MLEPSTIFDLLADNRDRDPQAPALLAPARPPLTHARLLQQVEETVATLKTFGIRSEDRVALVLDNGPEMAVGFLSAAACAACAPLNPSYKSREFDAAFAALHPKAVITSASQATSLGEIAAAHGIAVFEAVPVLDQEAGVFALEFRSQGASPTAPEQSGAALLLQTSGTTSQPKLVALTQTNLMISAGNIARSLELGAADRCLQIMPLFHIHGLVAGLLAPLRAGSSVVCCPGFQARRFFEWLGEFRPTWYTAVPTMHAAIAARGAQNREELSAHSLRFIRSCSAALPVRLMHELEERFGVPVLEAYGMTEASHQIACNPLPPAVRKPGSVGLATGTEFAILDKADRPLPPGAEGDIVVRGPSVISGYAENPSANAQSFVAGWLRTGDVGLVDDDGYLVIKGRAKEIINRGGAKISPYEIEAVLLEHPAVAEAVAFALEDTRLGEDVGAAVVLHSSACTTSAELCDFASGHLADFKVPRRIAVVDEIPKGPTGKLQRIGLAAKLGLELSAANATEPSVRVRPQNRLDELLLAMWARTLGVERVALDDNFFALGGDSVAATELLLAIEEATGTKLSIGALFDAPSVADLARLIEGADPCPRSQRVAAIRANGSLPPFFCVEAGPLFWPLAQRLGPDRPFFSLLLPPEDISTLSTVEEIAAFHVRSIRAVKPEGPYFIGGWCLKGVTAYEIAQQLRAQGQEVALLVLFDTVNPGRWKQYTAALVPLLQACDVLQTSWFHVRSLRSLKWGERLAYARERISRLLLVLGRNLSLLRSSVDPGFSDRLRSEHSDEFANLAGLRYRAKPYPGRALLFRRTLRPLGPGQDRKLGWGDLVRGGLAVADVSGDHVDMFLEPQVAYLSEVLSAWLEKPELGSVITEASTPTSPQRLALRGLLRWGIKQYR